MQYKINQQGRVSSNSAKCFSLPDETNLYQGPKEQGTVMIRFSSWGTYLLLVSQGRALIRDGVYSGQCDYLFFENNRMFKTKRH